MSYAIYKTADGEHERVIRRLTQEDNSQSASASTSLHSKHKVYI